MEKLRFIAESNGVGQCVLVRYKNRLSEGNSQSLSLTYGVVDDAGVLSCLFSVRENIFARNRLVTRVSLNERNIIAVRHIADGLTVGLVGIYQSMLLRKPAHVCFFHAVQREKCVLQLMLGHAVQHIGLILSRVG